MAELPNLQPEKPNFNPGENSRACGIPNLQPELSSVVPRAFYKWTPQEYPPESLPVIARSMPGYTLLIWLSLCTIMAMSLLVLIKHNFVCGLAFLGVMSLVFVRPVSMKYRTKAMQKKWFEWTVRHKDELCLDCGEPLHNLEDESICPSCTQPYSLDSSRWGWRKWRSVSDLEEHPPARPGPLHESQPCASILAGSPRPFRIILIVESLAVLVALVAYWIAMPLLDLQGVHVIVLFVVILAAIWFLIDRPTRAARKKAAEVDDLLCPECAYRLDDREPRGTCPECGFYYTFANCKWAWRHLRKDKNNPPTPPPFLVPGESTDK